MVRFIGTSSFIRRVCQLVVTPPTVLSFVFVLGVVGSMVSNFLK